MRALLAAGRELAGDNNKLLEVLCVFKKQHILIHAPHTKAHCGILTYQ